MRSRSKRRTTGVLAFAGLLIASTLGYTATAEAGTDSRQDPARVDTKSGPVRGLVTDTNRVFSGIPYAAPPTGELRWAAPQPAESWIGERDVTKPGSACPQPADQPIAVPSEGEDCLYLNVTTPAKTSHKPKPVIVWIHGGSLTYGDGASYGAQRLSAGADAVVVSINYRLGTFGFGAHTGLDSPVNLGLADQQLALRWVRDNVAAFGGDSGNVTIMGQSGGGYSVCGHLAAPGSDGLFDKAIVQSANCVGSDDAAMSLETAQENWRAMAKAAGCGEADIDCLRGKTAEDLVAASESGHDGFRLVPGDDILPLSPAEAVETGAIHKVPVLFGSNRDEESGRIGGMEVATGQVMTESDYVEQIGRKFGGDAEAVLAQYPVDSYDSPSQAMAAVLTDLNWSTPAWQTANALAAQVPTYTYEFAEPTPWYVGFERPSFPIGADHMAELAYLFDYSIFNPLSAKQSRFADDLIGYWGAFARSGDPNHHKSPQWTQFSLDAPYVQQLSADRTAVVDFHTDHHIEFWQSLNH